MTAAERKELSESDRRFDGMYRRAYEGVLKQPSADPNLVQSCAYQSRSGVTYPRGKWHKNIQATLMEQGDSAINCFLVAQNGYKLLMNKHFYSDLTDKCVKLTQFYTHYQNGVTSQSKQSHMINLPATPLAECEDILCFEIPCLQGFKWSHLPFMSSDQVPDQGMVLYQDAVDTFSQSAYYTTQQAQHWLNVRALSINGDCARVYALLNSTDHTPCAIMGLHFMGYGGQIPLAYGQKLSRSFIRAAGLNLFNSKKVRASSGMHSTIRSMVTPDGAL